MENQFNKETASVNIEAHGAGRGKVTVDGTDVRYVQSATAVIEAGNATKVHLVLAVGTTAQLRLDDASIVVDGVKMPITVERALWMHLAKKYGRETDVTTMESDSRRYALPES